MARDGSQDDAFRLAGDRLGKFVILQELGRGSMGVVYEAFQEDLKRKVALKILPANIALDAKQVRRFSREAESTARLRHDHIIPIYEVGQVERTHFFSMELIAGRPFGEGLGQGKEAVREAARLARDAARGLAHAHERGVIHRDIKPSNLLVDKTGRLVITDFGLARLTESTSLTSTDAIVGTPKYMSPEQILPTKRATDGRADVYSLGASLYEVLAGRTPIDAPSVQAFLRAILEERPPNPRRFNKDIPHDLATIVLRCLEKNPDDRYPNAEALADDLDRFLAGERILARPRGSLARIGEVLRRNRTVAALATLAAVALLATFVLGHKSETTQRDLDLQKQIQKLTNAEDKDLDGAMERMHALAAEYPSRPDLTGAVKMLHRRRARFLLERPKADFETALKDLVAGGEAGSFWHLMLLVETLRLDEARKRVQALPETDPTRRLVLARVALADKDYAKARALLQDLPALLRNLPADAHAYAYLTRGVALRGLALASSDPAPLLEAAQGDLGTAMERSGGMKEEWLRARIQWYRADVSSRIDPSGGFGQLLNAFAGIAQEALRGFSTFWGNMTRGELATVEVFVGHILDMAHENEGAVPSELEKRAREKLSNGALSPHDFVLQCLVLGIAQLSAGKLDMAGHSLERAKTRKYAQLEPYVLWGESLLCRAQKNIAAALQFALEALDCAGDDFPELSSLIRHTRYLCDEAERKGLAAEAKPARTRIEQILAKHPELKVH